jgi:hypothetical protein
MRLCIPLHVSVAAVTFFAIGTTSQSIAAALSQGQEPRSEAKSGSNTSDTDWSHWKGTWFTDGPATKELWSSVKIEPGIPFEFRVSDSTEISLVIGETETSATNQSTLSGVQVAAFDLVLEDDSALQMTFVGLGKGKGFRVVLIPQIESEDRSGIVLSREHKTSPQAKQGTALKLGYWTKVDSVDGDYVTLLNGAVLEPLGYLGYVGYGKRAFLYANGTRLWIEGKKSFSVSQLRPPIASARTTYSEKVVRTAADDGSLFVFTDGSMFDPLIPTYVGGYSEYQTCIVVGLGDLLFQDGSTVSGIFKP